jgi:UDP-N-acetylglucosamine 2-epimerase (non-hydrolysing)
MKITIVAGARPNFIKIAPLIHAINKYGNHKISYRLVHTGQHYDNNLSDTFFEELNIPEPDINLEVGSGTQAVQTANVMIKFEKELQDHPADYVVVVGDVNSTLACSVVAKKLNTKLIHIEAGIRSFDMSMPEEINRIVTDSLADYCFTTSEYANNNLIKYGVENERIYFVGNIMIDALQSNMHKFTKPELWDEHHLQEQKYWVLTLHRPSNVDNEEELLRILQMIDSNCGSMPVIFPVHPRTESRLKHTYHKFDNIVLTDPLSYFRFMYIVKYSIGVMTDSGGIQEETTVMNIPCLTLRKNTERPETVLIGSNELITDFDILTASMKKIIAGRWKKSTIPKLWDGKTAERIVEIMLTKLNN